MGYNLVRPKVLHWRGAHRVFAVFPSPRVVFTQPYPHPKNPDWYSSRKSTRCSLHPLTLQPRHAVGRRQDVQGVDERPPALVARGGRRKQLPGVAQLRHPRELSQGGHVAADDLIADALAAPVVVQQIPVRVGLVGRGHWKALSTNAGAKSWYLRSFRKCMRKTNRTIFMINLPGDNNHGNGKHVKNNKSFQTGDKVLRSLNT